MKKSITALLVLAAVSLAYAAEPPKIINLRNVVFDHEGHKGDCITCHDTQIGGKKIAGLSKEWAHKVCVGCHTSLGSGPTECKACHKK